MDVTPPVLLAEVVALAGALSAVLVNDIVCLAIAPILADVCSRRRLDPVPYLLALACAANVGSAATLMGNPQNMLIGQTLRLPFARYLLDAGLPSLLGLLVVWGVIARAYRKRWHRDVAVVAERRVPTFDRWQTGKGLLVLGMVVALFLATSLPREAVALSAAGVLLMSRRMASRDILGLVDWHLLVLFVGLFVVNHALEETGMLARATSGLLAAGIDVGGGWWAFGMAALLSNLVSNVPAVMLLLPAAEGHPMAGPMLALSSTLAGNLLIVGSIANIIVVEQAGRQGINIGWREHARVGVPVTLITLGLAAGWLAMLGDW
jgi:Na+/H+ antiporter NhaD/arsenite permease-like protein